MARIGRGFWMEYRGNGLLVSISPLSEGCRNGSGMTKKIVDGSWVVETFTCVNPCPIGSILC